MPLFLKTAIALMTAASLAPVAAMAVDTANCEIVVSNEVVDADGGRMTVASYRSADNFLAGVYDTSIPLSVKEDGAPIRGLICVRNDLVPVDADFKILATGVPLSLSQDFDSADSDILTVYFAKGEFAHKYTSNYPMSEEFEAAIKARLKDFSARDHRLVKPKQ